MIYQDKLHDYISMTMVLFVVLFFSTTIGFIWFAFKSNEKPNSFQKWCSIFSGAFAWSSYLSFGFFVTRAGLESIYYFFQIIFFPLINQVTIINEILKQVFIGFVALYVFSEMIIKFYSPNLYQSMKAFKLIEILKKMGNRIFIKLFDTQAEVAKLFLFILITFMLLWTGFINISTNNANIFPLIIICKWWIEFRSNCKTKDIPFIDLLIDIFKKKTK